MEAGGQPRTARRGRRRRGAGPDPGQRRPGGRRRRPGGRGRGPGPGVKQGVELDRDPASGADPRDDHAAMPVIERAVALLAPARRDRYVLLQPGAGDEVVEVVEIVAIWP